MILLFSPARPNFSQSVLYRMASPIQAPLTLHVLFLVSDEGWLPLIETFTRAEKLCCTHRICPGRYFALDNLFINIASTLHVFEIMPPLDGNGKPIKPGYSTVDSFMSCVTTILRALNTNSTGVYAVTRQTSIAQSNPGRRKQKR